MENKKIVVCIIVAVCILAAGIIVFALNTELTKNSTSTNVGNNFSVNNNSSANQANNSSNTNNTSENSVKSSAGSFNSETHEGVSKEQAKQRASEEIKGKDYIELGDPVWRDQDKMWDVPLFNNNKPYGNIYIYVENGKITKVVPYF
ncbi:MAG: hypothetical protein LBD03_08575 [Methanobrevibacter sp.]|jgi:uncharacterized membrane protein|nr:hypothetical protein [Candidatus Methanovirga procula]